MALIIYKDICISEKKPKDRGFSFMGRNYDIAKELFKEIYKMTERMFDVLWSHNYSSTFWEENIAELKKRSDNGIGGNYLDLYEEYKLGKSKQIDNDMVFFIDDYKKYRYVFMKIYDMTQVQFDVFAHTCPNEKYTFPFTKMKIFIVLDNDIYAYDHELIVFKKLTSNSLIVKYVMKIKKIADPLTYLLKHDPNMYNKYIHNVFKDNERRDIKINNMQKEINNMQKEINELKKS
jgi:hypothetical protein